MRSDTMAEACAPSARRKPRARFIVIERKGGAVFGDTIWLDHFDPVPRRHTPHTVVRAIQSTICDYFPYRHREVARDDAAATFDVYRAAPDYPEGASGEAVARDCEYVATLERIYPRCWFCRALMEYHPWQYGHDAEPVAKKGKRCCDRCYVRRVLPVRLTAEGYSQEEIDEHVRNERAYLGVVA